MNRHRNTVKRRRHEIAIIIVCTVVILLIGGVHKWGSAIISTGHRWLQSELIINDGSTEYEKKDISEEVLAYEDLIESYAQKYGISEYVGVIKAMMMQESGGKGTDVMQCSECHYNTEYANKPGAIEDAEYSIDTGIHYFADCLELAGCSGPGDTNRLKLALQGYNFGNSYINWALERDGYYTQEGANEFSELMKEKTGWSNYGDTEYPAHVLRYYQD